jgi:Zn-dependent protease
MTALLLFQIIILVCSVMIHELSHGLVAFRLGDPTAKLAGRLTLNPFKHLDLVGSFLVPLATLLLSGFVFGWAKPVPYNPNFLKDPKRGAGLIAAAGPLSNFLLAAIFGAALRMLSLFEFSLMAPLVVLFQLIILINLVLGVFNLVPIPPLDGSKVLFSFLPETGTAWKVQSFLERYGLLLLIFFLFYGFGLITPIILFLFGILAGMPPVL